MCTNLHHLNCTRQCSRQCLRQPSMHVTSTAITQTGIINRLRRTVRRWAIGHSLPKQCYSMTQRSPRASSLLDGTPTPTRTWHSPWAVGVTQSQNDASLIDSRHRPTIIKVPSLVQPIARKPAKRCKFRKSN